MARGRRGIQADLERVRPLELLSKTVERARVLRIP
jgi:hypothetical protein